MIEVKNITKRYGDAVVLDDITVSFADGAIHGLVGRNGSGKTLLMKIMTGLIRPSAGTVVIDGKTLGKELQVPDSLGAIIETPGFLPYCSGRKNLMLLASLKKKIGRAQVDDAIRQVGLDPASRKWVSKYSMGMRQRLGIAQAIMEDARLLVLDEPMNGLDNQGVEDMRSLLLAQKARGKTIVLASHNREDIDILCDRVYAMDAGRLETAR